MFEQGFGQASLNQSEYSDNFKKYSKTFSFAASFFGKKMANDTAKLYFFFRQVDDIADENVVENIDQKKNLIQNALKGAELTSLKDEYDIPIDVVEIFIKYAIADIELTKIESRKQLLEYCYAVASSVGICMCKLFKVKKTSAYYHAIDLGIAMQLTNMCRDVYEDYNNNRLYLPELSKDMIEYQDKEKIQSTIISYLDLADKYYESAYRGLVYLPLRVRFVIYLAANLYQKIGYHIKKNNNYKIRSYTKKNEKIFMLLNLSFKFCFKLLIKKFTPHEKNLHEDIAEMPYAHV